MSGSGYSHSPYFRAKKAAEASCAADESAASQKLRKNGGRHTSKTGRRLKSAEDRAAMFGKVELWRTKEILAIASNVRAPRSFRSYDLGISIHLAALGIAISADIGEAMVRDLRAVADPEVREAMVNEFRRTLRIVRRPWYYARETARRRQLAAERRKLHRRTTANPCPTAEQLLAAWEMRKDSKDAMIRLGGMLQDLECYVDNTLRFDEDGSVVGRNGGIRGWLAENLSELLPKYKTLMRYKAMAIRLRQATKTQDPLPTDRILTDMHDPVAQAILASPGDSFASLQRAIDFHINADQVLREPIRGAGGGGGVNCPTCEVKPEPRGSGGGRDGHPRFKRRVKPHL